MAKRKKIIDKGSKKMRLKRPKQSEALYNALFKNSKEKIISLISNGIRELHMNAEKLLDDFDFLLKGKRFTSSDFILFTAAEELSKIYILIDMLRLDFQKTGRLKRLCSAFYSHILKSVYFEIIRYPVSTRDMKHLQEIAEVEKQEYWPARFESCEPDMINYALLRKEMSLYVDFSEYDGIWIPPSHSVSKTIINSGNSMGYQEDTMAIFKRIERASNEGYFDTNCLTIFHDVFSRKEIGIGMPEVEIQKIYENFIKEVEKTGIKTVDKIERANPLLGWPIYAVL